LIAIGIGELFLNASLSDWWGGLGFGSRRLTDQTLLLALGYGAVFDWLRAHRLATLALVGVAGGVAWTVLLLANFYYVIRTDVGPSWHDFLLGQVQAIRYVPRAVHPGNGRSRPRHWPGAGRHRDGRGPGGIASRRPVAEQPVAA